MTNGNTPESSVVSRKIDLADESEAPRDGEAWRHSAVEAAAAAVIYQSVADAHGGRPWTRLNADRSVACAFTLPVKHQAAS